MATNSKIDVNHFAALATFGQNILDAAKDAGLLKMPRRPYKRRASSNGNLNSIVMPEGEAVPILEIDEPKPKRKYRKRRKAGKSVSLTEIETPTARRPRRQPVK